MDMDDDSAVLLAEFSTWLDRERGLSPVSVRCYSKQAKAFLAAAGGPGAVSGLDAGQVTAFMVDHSRGRNTWSAKAMVTSLRAFLRFAHATGRTAVPLAGAVPAVASWRLASLGAGPHIRCYGKGRKDRATPLTSQTVKVLRTWLAECSPAPDGPLFPSRAAGRLSRDAVERLVAKHASTAADSCPSIKAKNVTPHTLRHTAAMSLMRGGVDTSVIALWLGHEDAETTQVYLHADMTIKEQALARVQPPGTSPGRYRPPDTLLAFLDNL